MTCSFCFKIHRFWESLMKNHIRKSYIFLMVVALLAAALACNLPQGETAKSPAVPEQADPPESAPPADEAPPPEGEQPADNPLPPESPAAEAGMSRTNPYPIDTDVVTPYWDFRVLEVARGEAAWQIMQADSPESPPPPPGKEYFLVKVWVRCKNPDPGSHDIDLNDLFITGDQLQGYTDVIQDHPAPEFFYSDIFTAESLEGWIDILVDPSEGNMMLVFDREEYIGNELQPRDVRYVALEGGASIEVPTGLEGVTANEIGTDRENPAQIDDTVITKNWEITVLESLRGQAALDIVMQLSERNKPPEDGMEYVAFRVRGRRISTMDLSENLSASDFTMIVPGMGRNGSDQMDDPFIYLDSQSITPYFIARLFPGGEIEGWAIKEVPGGHTPLLIRFNHILPSSSSADWDKRDFSLEP